MLTHPCSTRECHESQVGTYQAVGVDNILEHSQIGGGFLFIVVNRGKNCDGKWAEPLYIRVEKDLPK